MTKSKTPKPIRKLSLELSFKDYENYQLWIAHNKKYRGKSPGPATKLLVLEKAELGEKMRRPAKNK